MDMVPSVTVVVATSVARLRMVQGETNG